MHRRRRRAALLAVSIATAGLMVMGGGGVAVLSVPGTLGAIEQQIMAELSKSDRRLRLSSALARIAAARPTVSLAGSAHGVVLGGTVHVPADLALDGQTTIVAQHIVLSSPTLRVTGTHPLRLYPANGLSVAGQAAGLVITIDRSGTAGSAGARESLAAEVPPDRTGTTGSTGEAGASGAGGSVGSSGISGQDARLIDSEQPWCEPATSGDSGSSGGQRP